MFRSSRAPNSPTRFKKRGRDGDVVQRWYNGLAKKHYFTLPRAKEGLHQVIVHCKANQDKKVIQAIDFVMKE